MRTFMAGATITWVSVASRSVEARSEANPHAMRANKVGSSGGHDEQICGTGEADMIELGFRTGIMHLLGDRFAGDARDGKRRDELPSTCGQHAAHPDPVFAQPTDQFQRLVCRDAASDDQQHGSGVGHESSFARPGMNIKGVGR